MPNLCGVNQKIFAEALSKIKKTATPGAKSGTKNATTSEGGEGEVLHDGRARPSLHPARSGGGAHLAPASRLTVELVLAVGVVGDDHLQRSEDTHHAGCNLVEIITYTMLQ